MPKQPLPENPSLENLKKKVKQLQKRVRAGDAEALAQVREFHPRAEEAIADRTYPRVIGQYGGLSVRVSQLEASQAAQPAW